MLDIIVLCMLLQTQQRDILMGVAFSRCLDSVQESRVVEMVGR